MPIKIERIMRAVSSTRPMFLVSQLRCHSKHHSPLFSAVDCEFPVFQRLRGAYRFQGCAETRERNPKVHHGDVVFSGILFAQNSASSFEI